VVRADEVGRLSICADDTCGGVVVDLSRSRSRRFCRTACGNRVSAATHRARRSG
ncbi:CGNR zinc finger domain-containing protein, partial [Pseudonocardia sp. KRD-188]|nr:CGNR zinc finger domain-containing protein [Pseudonocardia oceani]